MKHDAATVWVENIKTNAFTVCLRELQNFDGQHKDIKVVSEGPYTLHFSILVTEETERSVVVQFNK